MKKNALYVMFGLAGFLSAVHSANAAQVDLTVVIQQANDDGELVGVGEANTWDLDNNTLWSTSMVGKHEISDLVSSDLGWNVGGAASFAGIEINDLKFDMDPLLSFDFTLNNNTAFNQTYSIYYNTPLVPNLTGVVNASANLTAVLTDVAGSNVGAKISPLSGSSILRAFDITVNGTEIPKNVDVGNTFIIGNTGPRTATKNWSAVNTLLCGTGEFACETMSAVLTLTLSKGDKVRLYGEVEQIEAVPLPSSAVLLGSMLALLAGVRRKLRAA
ncbi:MAG: hypothetical protein RL497_1533 [Pseudomonadota bacterium]